VIDESSSTRRRGSFWRELPMLLIVAIVVAVVVRAFVLQTFYIPSESMEKTLLINDRVLVNKLIYNFRSPHRGEVIVFEAPANWRSGVADEDFIKRVIGIPGDIVACCKDGHVTVNGQPLDEPYVHFLQPPSANSEFHEETGFDVRERYGPVTVPPNQYFVMGDNRDNSQDSRYWGFLPRENVKGKALLIYWSYEGDREDYQDESASATIKSLFSVFTHFFTRTRWDRMLHQIH